MDTPCRRHRIECSREVEHCFIRMFDADGAVQPLDS
jgi:hypothetical protein